MNRLTHAIGIFFFFFPEKEHLVLGVNTHSVGTFLDSWGRFFFRTKIIRGENPGDEKSKLGCTMNFCFFMEEEIRLF